jgi:hypothetical protein
MECTLDFLRYDPDSVYSYIAVPDGILTTEFGLMEYYARRGAETRTNDDFWCDAQVRPYLLCLDIAAPSTLGNSLNSSWSGVDVHNSMLIYDVQRTANETSTQLFGQTRRCGGRLMGDGVIDVFDISTMLSYLFSDWMYGTTLSADPEQVYTVHGREQITTLCDAGMTRREYAFLYSVDTCSFSGTTGLTTSEGRRLQQQQPYTPLVVESAESVGIYLVPCESHAQCLIIDREVYMAFVAIRDATWMNVSGIQDATVYMHELGIAISRSQRGGGVMRPTNTYTRRILLPLSATVVRATAFRSESEQMTAVSRTSYPSRWTNDSTLTNVDAYGTVLRVGRGVWTTVSFHGGVPLRLHAVFHEFFTAYLSSKPFVTEQEHPIQNEVRVTSICTPEQCPYCASVETALNGRVAMLRGTLELLQIPIRSACDFVVHIYAPQTVHLDYAIVSETHVFEQPAWSHISCVDRGIWTPTTLYPPPPPALRPFPALPPPEQHAPRWWVWIVSVSMVVLGCCCCVLVHVTILVEEDCECETNRISSTKKYVTVRVARISKMPNPMKGVHVDQHSLKTILE